MHSSDDEEDGCEVGSEDGTSSNSSSHKHTSFDRHLVLVGRFSILILLSHQLAAYLITYAENVIYFNYTLFIKKVVRHFKNFSIATPRF